MLGSLFLAALLHFTSPVNYDITLAGNFGEPRPHHFHGGIDVKTGGVEGKAILSIADGYVSRVTVGLYGFGNAVYVQHPGGYTSVYCHLKRFSPQIAAAVKRWQYQHQSYSADVRLKATDCPVSEGQVIATSGNTGSSQAPHLHLEIHDTKTWNMLDPLDYLKDYVADKMPPQAHGFMACPVQGEGVFNGGSNKQNFGFSSHHLQREFYAWGKVGFALWANDYMEATYNHYGIRYTQLKVDGREVFWSDVSNIPVDMNRLVNSWGDYAHKLRSNVWYLKSFVEPGNYLPMLHADENRGIINFNEERDYQVVYTISDFANNTSEYSFTIRGHRQALPGQKSVNAMRLMRWDRTNYYNLPGMRLRIPTRQLPDNVELRPLMRRGTYSDVYRFYATSYPLFTGASVSLRCKQHVADPSKLYVVCHLGSPKYLGGVYKDGWVTATIRDLGVDYELAYDDQPPLVNMVSTGEQITIGMVDKHSGLRSYKAFIDDEFVLFEQVPKSQWVRCKLSETPVKKNGKMHRLKFIATDNRQNQRTFEALVKY
ncbi:MAG: M23 family metallopeptidase [Prevotella sp.]|nr:M23 family metallopeptidase [Prevotella sp.]